jgi:transglutaminase-like putative cysteine protease
MKKWLISAVGSLCVLLLLSSAALAADSVLSNAKAKVDVSDSASGYVKVAYTGGQDKKIKVRVTAPNKVAYDFDINNKGEYETLPLSEGSGKYTVSVLVNIEASKYSTAFTADTEVKLSSEFAPFLTANQYVNFNSKSVVVAKAAELSKDKATDLDKINAMYEYVVSSFSYDKEKAKTVQSGYVPVVDAVLDKKTGICFDYSAVLASMMRSQKIPCKLVIGYAETVYHAWINIYTDETGWLEGYISFDGKNWKRADPTYDSTGKGSDKIKEYIKTDANYQPKFSY